MSFLYRARPPNILNIASYVAARIVRIAPIYYAIVLISWLIYTFVDHNFTYELSNTQFIRLLTFNGSVAVFWSIGPEVQFYAVFVILWWLWHQPFGRFSASTLAGLLCISAWMGAGHLSGTFFISKSPVFLSGIVASIVYDRFDRAHFHNHIIVLMQAISIALLIMMAQPFYTLTLIYPPHDKPDPTFSTFYCDPVTLLVAAFIVLSFSFSTRLSRLLFANPVARYLGEISFSLYLLHEIVLDAFAKWGGRGLGGDGMASAAAILLCIFVAYVSYRLIEVISRDRLRQPVTRLLASQCHFWLSRRRSNLKQPHS